MTMKAHLYRIPSGFANIDDKIIIKSKPMESHPGEWLYAEISLPEGYQALETEYGEGFIITNTGETIMNVYAGLPKIVGNTIRSNVFIYGSSGQILKRFWPEWK